MIHQAKRRILLWGILLSLVLAPGAFFNDVWAAHSPDNGSPTIIFLTASWCGTCREVSSVVQHIVDNSPDLGLKLVVLDVDQASAPAQASSYGIMVTGADVPQVYLASHGKTTLLFNGRDYKFGQSKMAEAQIQEELHHNL